MTTKIFEINQKWDGHINGETIEYDGKIELDERILNAVDDEWRANFYNLETEQEIAEHIAFNIVVNRAKIWELDGWANMPHDITARIFQ